MAEAGSRQPADSLTPWHGAGMARRDDRRRVLSTVEAPVAWQGATAKSRPARIQVPGVRLSASLDASR